MAVGGVGGVGGCREWLTFGKGESRRVFSVMACTVSLQTQEIGIRIALGAQQGERLRMVLQKGVALIATGFLLDCSRAIGSRAF
jgi:uncharacterized protein YfaS (alpha-2-macroglobulin family)